MQLANEPDLYGKNGLRGPEYSPTDFHREFGQMLQGYKDNRNVPITNNFVAPNVCCGGIGGGWFPEQVFETGFLDTYEADVKYVSVEQYVHHHHQQLYRAKYLFPATQRIIATLPDRS
jgi:hypothetical protein